MVASLLLRVCLSLAFSFPEQPDKMCQQHNVHLFIGLKEISQHQAFTNLFLIIEILGHGISKNSTISSYSEQRCHIILQTNI